MLFTIWDFDILSLWHRSFCILASIFFQVGTLPSFILDSMDSMSDRVPRSARGCKANEGHEGVRFPVSCGRGLPRAREARRAGLRERVARSVGLREREARSIGLREREARSVGLRERAARANENNEYTPGCT